jgi:hypothetical protein
MFSFREVPSQALQRVASLEHIAVLVDPGLCHNEAWSEGAVRLLRLLTNDHISHVWHLRRAGSPTIRQTQPWPRLKGRRALTNVSFAPSDALPANEHHESVHDVHVKCHGLLPSAVRAAVEAGPTSVEGQYTRV